MFIELIASIALFQSVNQGPIAWPPAAAALESSLPSGSSYHGAYAATAERPFVVTFFSMYSPQGRQAWFARRQFITSAGTANDLWAAASDCPALYSAMDWLSDIQPPSIHFSGLRRLPEAAAGYTTRPVRGPLGDGPTYWVSGSGWGPDRSLVHVTFTSTGGYVADWGAATTQHLEPCWTSKPPS